MKRAAAKTPLPRRKKLLFVFFALLLALLVAGAAGEILVRLLYPRYTVDDLRAQSLLYRGAIFCRHVLLREPRVIRDIPHPESMRIVINAKGFRGGDFAVRKPAGVTRIVFLGGSAVFGYQLKGPEADWPHLVQKKLRALGHGYVECLNAGTPGHASFDVLGRLYSEIHLYSPDWIVFYECFNDMLYFTWLSPERTLLDGYEPQPHPDDPRITYRGRLDRLLCYSQLYTKLRTHYYDRKHSDWRTGVPAQAAFLRERREELKAPTEFAFRQYRLNVALICDAARNIGARTLLLTQARLAGGPEVSIIETTPWDVLKMDEATFRAAYACCDTILREVAAEKGAEFLDVSGEVSGRPEYFFDIVHLSPAGAERVATLVAEHLDILLRAEAK